MIFILSSSIFKLKWIKISKQNLLGFIGRHLNHSLKRHRNFALNVLNSFCLLGGHMILTNNEPPQQGDTQGDREGQCLKSSLCGCSYRAICHIRENSVQTESHREKSSAHPAKEARSEKKLAAEITNFSVEFQCGLKEWIPVIHAERCNVFSKGLLNLRLCCIKWKQKEVGFFLPFSINIGGRQSSSDGSHNGSQDSGHAVQIVNPAGVLDFQLFLQDGLFEGNRRWYSYMVTVVVEMKHMNDSSTGGLYLTLADDKRG